MGYYGDFVFDFSISADKVEAAEAKLREAVLRESLITEDEAEKPFAEIWDSVWDDCDSAFEERPSPLEALANGCARGQISVQGGTCKKWRSWEEPLFEMLGEFAVGEISVKGEDCDTPTTWSYAGDGNWRVVDYELVDGEELARLRDIEQRHQRALELLSEIRDLQSAVELPAIMSEIGKFLTTGVEEASEPCTIN